MKREEGIIEKEHFYFNSSSILIRTFDDGGRL